MERRQYLSILSTMGVTALSGCGTIESVFGGEDEDREERKRVKNNAESPSWDKILDNIDTWRGEPVYYPDVQRVSLTEMNNGSYTITVNHSGYSTPAVESLYCDWFGDRDALTKSMDIWGTVEGTHTYPFGEEQTVPDIHLVDTRPNGV